MIAEIKGACPYCDGTIHLDTDAIQNDDMEWAGYDGDKGYCSDCFTDYTLDVYDNGDYEFVPVASIL